MRTFRGGTGGDNLLGADRVIASSQYNGGQVERICTDLAAAVTIGERTIDCMQETEGWVAGRHGYKAHIWSSAEVPGGLVRRKEEGVNWQGKQYANETIVVDFARNGYQ